MTIGILLLVCITKKIWNQWFKTTKSLSDYKENKDKTKIHYKKIKKSFV